MSVHSYDGSAWSTKLKRIGELSAQDRNLAFNNLGHLVSVEMLREMYRRLDGTKAVGVDGVTKEAYGTDLNRNLEFLLQRIRRGTYRPRPARIVEIPKEDGSTRPLAISCLEDKIVQLAVSTILNTIYEPLFLPCSFGFRPKLGCHDALKALSSVTFQVYDGAVVEVDLRKYFNTIPHGPLLEFLQRKIHDHRFVRLITVLLQTATIKADGTIEPNVTGSPQGSIVSPVLSNVYLHHVIDEWFSAISQTHLRREAWEIRYADDMVFVFRSVEDAERFYRALDKRLDRFGIEMHAEKSRLIPSGRTAAARAHAAGGRLPTYKFLGFTCYWGLSRNGKLWRLKVKSRSDRKRAKLKGLRKYLRQNLNTPDTPTVLNTVRAVVRGWVNYHAVSDNSRAVHSFVNDSRRILFRWFNRRGGRKPMTWSHFARLMDRIDFPKLKKLTPLFSPPKQARA